MSENNRCYICETPVAFKKARALISILDTDYVCVSGLGLENMSKLLTAPPKNIICLIEDQYSLAVLEKAYTNIVVLEDEASGLLRRRTAGRMQLAKALRRDETSIRFFPIRLVKSFNAKDKSVFDTISASSSTMAEIDPVAIAIAGKAKVIFAVAAGLGKGIMSVLGFK